MRVLNDILTELNSSIVIVHMLYEYILLNTETSSVDIEGYTLPLKLYLLRSERNNM